PDDVLPIGPERQMLLEQDTSLAWTIKAEAGVAPAHGSRRAKEIQLLKRRIITSGQDERRTWLAALIHFEEVAGQACPLIRDADRLKRRGKESSGLPKCLALPVKGVEQPGINRHAKQGQKGGAKVIGTA